MDILFVAFMLGLMIGLFGLIEFLERLEGK